MSTVRSLDWLVSRIFKLKQILTMALFHGKYLFIKINENHV